MAATGQSAGGGAGQASGGDAGQGAQGFDAAALQAQLQQATGGVDDLRAQFSQFSQQFGDFGNQLADLTQGDPEAEIDLSHLDEGYDFDPGIGTAEMEHEAQRQAEAAAGLASLIQQHSAAAIAPAMEQVSELRREQQVRDLIGEFPQFQDPEYANEIAGPNGLAVQYAHQIGEPSLAMKPSFWRVVHMAHANAMAANAEEGAEDPAAAMLESGRYGRGGGGGKPDIAGGIIAGRAGKGAGVLPFPG